MTDSVSSLPAANVRIFIQTDGISPAAAYDYYGCLSLDGPNQDLGTPDPLYCPSPNQRGRWDIIDDITKAQALGTTDFTAHADRTLSDVWFELKRRGCKFNMQAVLSNCARPDNFALWDAKLVFMGTRLNNLGLTALNPLTGDDNQAVDFTGTLSFRDWDTIQAIKFAATGESTIVAEVLDGFYYDVATCGGECGAPSDGCDDIYLLTAASGGSPGLSSQLVYSNNGGGTWTTVDIAPMAGLSGNRAAPMGDKIVVVSQASGAHFYSAITGLSSTSWTKVSTGYVSTKGPRAIYVKSSNQAFVAGAGGYVYYLSSPTGGATVLTDGSITTQDLNDIAGKGKTIVAVGGSNAVLWSANDGDSFSLVTGPAVGVNLSAVWVFSSTVWLIGTGAGTLWYTIDSGTTWTQIGLPGGASVINDIRFENEVVGYIAAEVGGVATVFRTTDSGNSWYNTAPHISSLPTAVRANFVYPCGMNQVLAGGRKTVGGDGLAAIAQ